MTTVNETGLLTLLFYVGILVCFSYLFYFRVCSLALQKPDLGRLAKDDLHLAHLLELMEAPDVLALSDSPIHRKGLFSRFASFMLADIQRLLRSRPLGSTTLLWLGLFFLSYAMVRVKAWIGWGRNDLRFLAGLELAVIRSLRESP